MHRSFLLVLAICGLGAQSSSWPDDSSLNDDINRLLRAVQVCVPPPCRKSTLRRLIEKLSVVGCGEVGRRAIVDCLQTELPDGQSVLNVQLGEICCSLWPHTSALCRTACRGALNSVTLSAQSKAARIKAFCYQSDNADDRAILQPR